MSFYSWEFLEEVSKDQNYLEEAKSLTIQVYHQAGIFESLLAYVENWSAPSFTKKDQLLIADAYFFLDRYKDAITYYKDFLLVNPKDEACTVMKLVHALYATQQYQEAMIYLQQLSGQQNHIGQMVAYYRGLIYEKEGATQEAINSFSEAMQLVFDLQLCDLATIKQAAIYYQQGALSDVIQAMHGFIKLHPDSQYLSVAQFLLAKCYYKTKAYQEAIIFIENLPYKTELLLQLYQKALFFQGLVLYNRGDFKEVIRHLKRSLDFPFKSTLVFQAQFWLAEAFTHLTAYHQALAYYKGLIQHGGVGTPYYEKVLYGLAYAYFNMGSYSDAAQAFEQYIGFTHNRPAAAYYNATLRLGDCYYAVKNYEKALYYYQSIYDHYPAHVRYQEALIYELLGDTSQATKCLAEVITCHVQTPYYTKALYQQACTLFNNGCYEMAIQKFSDLLDKCFSVELQPDLLMKRALAYENLQKYKEASADYMAILDQYTTHMHAENALMALSNLLTKQGTPEQVDSYLKKYSHIISASHSDIHDIDKAKQFFDHQAYDRVIAQLSTFDAKYPKSALISEAYFLVAESYYRLGKSSQALSYYKKIVVTDHVIVKKALLRIADITLQAKKYKEALYYYQKLEQLSLDRKTYLRMLMGISQSSFELKQYKITTLACLKVLDSVDDLPIETMQQARLYLGKVAMMRSEYKNAKSHFLKAHMPLHTATSAEAQYLLAFVTYKLKAYQSSLNYLFELIEKYPHNKKYIDDAYLLMADSYGMLGNWNQAKATLDSIIKRSKNKKAIAIAKQKKREAIAKGKENV